MLEFRVLRLSLIPTPSQSCAKSFISVILSKDGVQTPLRSLVLFHFRPTARRLVRFGGWQLHMSVIECCNVQQCVASHCASHVFILIASSRFVQPSEVNWPRSSKAICRAAPPPGGGGVELLSHRHSLAKRRNHFEMDELRTEPDRARENQRTKKIPVVDCATGVNRKGQ